LSFILKADLVITPSTDYLLNLEEEEKEESDSGDDPLLQIDVRPTWLG